MMVYTPATTTTTDNNNNSINGNSWMLRENKKKKNNSWTEVISKQNKRQQQLNINDPFAGMKSSIDYEQEIERLKQMVPRQRIQQQQQQQQQQKHYPEISRSSSPDTIHSSDSDISLVEPNNSQSQSIITSREERNRFLTFVRNWTGDYKGSYYSHNDDDEELTNNNYHYNDNSLWAEQLPWTTCPTTSNTTTNITTTRHYQYNNNFSPYYHLNNNNTAAHSIPNNNINHTTPPHHDLYWQIRQPIKPTTVQTPSSYTHWQNQQPYSSKSNRHGQQPIGMGRSLKKQTYSYHC